MRTLTLLSAAALSTLAALSGGSRAEAQYVDLYTLNAYCSAGYYEACAALDAYAMQMQAPAGYGYGYGAYDPYAAHEQRMDDIHAWGSQMMANGAASSALLDQRHESFMQTLRE